MLAEEEGRIGGRLAYASELYESERMGAMLAHLGRVLAGMVADEQCPVMDLPLLSAEERQQILEEWNQTQQPWPATASVMQQIARQARQRGEAVAISAARQQVSYGELERRAEQLGQYLRQQGVRREQAVGICLRRGVEYVVAALAVLKAGGAYVPLDRRNPAARLGYMVKDAAVKVIISEAALAAQVEAVMAAAATAVEVI